ncbi:peptidase S45 [Actinorhabdospora filicis]|uniref:Peptidase S45 n=1 Tax=Actinorhabdospora filicis TaxID=1785913 RepID=A0A9W6SHU1_9ACTN|nr:penicillin acylase family protein [Actinorhabdospora filicis]GLZ75729.1 peptidase S45 [Actinorhabdospora filicis]
MDRARFLRLLRRIGFWTLAVVTVLLLVVSLGFAWIVRRSFPTVDGELQVKGMSGKVDVWRDERGIPQIYADTATDLFRAEGFVHAQDRFWEMDFRRHITSGRLSEMFGESQVATDSAVRAMGWRKVAEQEWEILDATTKSYFTAYAEGVNAYLEQNSAGKVSLEYTVLGLSNPDYEIEPWSPIDSLAWLKAMAWDLRGNLTDELGRATLASAGLTPKQIAQLYPRYPGDRHNPIVGGGEVEKGVFTPGDKKKDDKGGAGGGGGEGDGAALQRAQGAFDAVSKVTGPAIDGVGSNSWVISGKRTETGLPILANDPHLSPAMPSVWYQVGLRCRTVGPECPYQVTGFTFSGVPGVIIGHNASIAWGFTNLGPDVTDLYVERVDGDKYLVDGNWLPVESRQETIKVAGKDPVNITVRTTKHGPIMSDFGDTYTGLAEKPPTPEIDGPGQYAVSLRWTALDPGKTAEAIFALNKANNWPEFKAAASRFEVPAQNMIYADTSGNIGYQAPGRIPIRGTGDGTWPSPGWDSGYDWTGYIPAPELPFVVNPDDGFIVTANNEVIGEEYPYLLTEDWAYGYRSQRIRYMIEASEKLLTIDDIRQMQMDGRNGGAVPVVPKLLAIPTDGKVKPAQDLLRDWDLQSDRDSAATAFYNATWRHLLIDTFDELPQDLAPGGGERWYEVVGTIIDEPDSPWWDVKATPEKEDRDAILKRAMAEAVDELTQKLGPEPTEWRWDELHTLTLRNQSLGTSGIGFVEWLFNEPPVGVSGGDGIVNATGWDASEGYEVDAVPSMRMVVDLANWDGSWWVNLTGQSGHAFSAHYDDQVQMWRTGALTPMRWSDRDIEVTTRDRLTLVP